MSLTGSTSIQNAASIDTDVEPYKPRDLYTLPPIPDSDPVLAVDFDDVLCQTNALVAKWHNEAYGTNMTLDDFFYYYYWKNPYWGTPSETFDKVKRFHAEGHIHNAEPLPGAREGVLALRDMGFRLVVVTARNQDVRYESWTWLEHHFPGMFETIICTGQFKSVGQQAPGSTDSKEHKSPRHFRIKISKADVCKDLRALLLIDDSLENALHCSHEIPVLLFGSYAWNQRVSGPEDIKDDMSFAVRNQREPGFWQRDNFDLESVVKAGSKIERAKDWGHVLKWMVNAKEAGVFDHRV